MKSHLFFSALYRITICSFLFPYLQALQFLHCEKCNEIMFVFDDKNVPAVIFEHTYKNHTLPFTNDQALEKNQIIFLSVDQLWELLRKNPHMVQHIERAWSESEHERSSSIQSTSYQKSALRTSGKSLIQIYWCKQHKVMYENKDAADLMQSHIHEEHEGECPSNYKMYRRYKCQRCFHRFFTTRQKGRDHVKKRHL